MFGLEDQKKKKKDEFIFDLEKELKTQKRYREIKETMDGRIQTIKRLLQDGKEQDSVDQYGALLHGYTSLLKVMARGIAK